MRQYRPMWRPRTLLFAAVAVLSFAAPAPSSSAQSSQERIQLCGTCHGEDGNSIMENTPSLAGQPELFITNQLILFREGLRLSEVMAPFAKGMKDDDIAALAQHYSRLAPASSKEPVDQTLVERGKELAGKFHCGSCHLPSYEGQEQMPRLARQRIDYLILSMKAYRDGTRSGIDTSMNGVMYQVPDQDIAALAQYLASLR